MASNHACRDSACVAKSIERLQINQIERGLFKANPVVEEGRIGERKTLEQRSTIQRDCFAPTAFSVLGSELAKAQDIAVIFAGPQSDQVAINVQGGVRVARAQGLAQTIEIRSE